MRNRKAWENSSRPMAWAWFGFLTASAAVSATAELVPIGTDFQVNTYTVSAQSYPAVAASGNGDFVVAWQIGQFGAEDIFAQRYASGGSTQGTEFQVSTYTPSSQVEAAIASGGNGGFVVAWTSRSGEDGSASGVFARRYASDGTAKGAEFQVNTYTPFSQFHPVAAASGDGDFVVAWNSLGQDGGIRGVFAQRFASDGTKQGAEFQVNSYTPLDQFYPVVAVAGNGDFIVAWQSLQDGSGFGVFAQRYTSNGTKQGAEFQVNTYTPDFQYYAEIAADGDGDFLVAWTSRGQDGSADVGVFAQRYASNGAKQGTEFQVNTSTLGSQFRGAVAADGDGGFVVSWNSYPAQDGYRTGIFAQRYASDGTKQGTEFQVNTYTRSSEYAPAVAGGGGRFVVAWQSYGQDGDAAGIFAKLYAAPTVHFLKGRISYYGGDRPVQGVILRVSNSGASAMTDQNGEFILAVPADGVATLQPEKLDDVRGAISSFDAAFALQHSVHIITLDADQQLACDVTGNGEVTSLDDARILQFRVHIIDQFAAAADCGSDWLFVPVPDPAANQSLVQPVPSADPSCQPGAISYTSLIGNPTGQNFTAILIGDCTGNWGAQPQP